MIFMICHAIWSLMMSRLSKLSLALSQIKGLFFFFVKSILPNKLLRCEKLQWINIKSTKQHRKNTLPFKLFWADSIWYHVKVWATEPKLCGDKDIWEMGTAGYASNSVKIHSFQGIASLSLGWNQVHVSLIVLISLRQSN